MKSFHVITLIACLTQAGSTSVPVSSTPSADMAEASKAKSTVDAHKVAPAPAMKLKELIKKINSKREADEPAFDEDEPRREEYFDEEDDMTMDAAKIVVDLDTDTKVASQNENGVEKMMQSVMEKIRDEIRKYARETNNQESAERFNDEAPERGIRFDDTEAPESVKPKDMATQQDSEVEFNTLRAGQRLRHAI